MTNQKLEKQLPNGWTVVLDFWGKNDKPNVYAVLTEYEKIVYDSTRNYERLIKTKIDGITIQKSFVRLDEGTSFGNRNTEMALETIERRLLLNGNGRFV